MRNQTLRKMLRELSEVQRKNKRFYNMMQRRQNALRGSSLVFELGELGHFQRCIDVARAAHDVDGLRKILRSLNEARQEEKAINRAARERRLAEQNREPQTYTVCAR